MSHSMLFLSNEMVIKLAALLDTHIRNTYENASVAIYAIPRGGIPAAYALASVNNGMHYEIVDSPNDADIFVDDIIDSGETMQKWCDDYPEKPFYALIDKTNPTCQFLDKWVVFPWEQDANSSVNTSITRLLQYVGEDPTREGLLETPRRVVKAWDHWTSGYDKNPEDILKVFEDGAENCDEMVIVKDIPIYSLSLIHI